MSRPEPQKTSPVACAEVHIPLAAHAHQSPESSPGSHSHPVPPHGIERRRSPRQTLVAKAVLRAETSPAPVATGFISNVSMLGIGFHTRRPLPVGGKYLIRVEAGPMQWAARLRVVSCQLHGGTYDVGAEFVGSDLAPPASHAIAA